MLIGFFLIVCPGWFLGLYWMKYQKLPWEKELEENDTVTTSIENVIDSLEVDYENPQEFNPAEYGSITYLYDDQGNQDKGIVIFYGKYISWNRDNNSLVIELAETLETLSLRLHDEMKFYYYPKNISKEVLLSNTGITFSPNSAFPFSTEERESYRIDTVDIVPPNSEFIVHGTIEYPENETTFTKIEFFQYVERTTIDNN